MPRCMIHMDIRKAYDSVDYKDMKFILSKTGFLIRFIGWVIQVVTILTYQFNLNGQDTRSMKAAIGPSQGDLISPLLFAVVMEYLHKDGWSEQFS